MENNCIFQICSFNRPEADFPGLQEWNDYLEQREDISALIAFSFHWLLRDHLLIRNCGGLQS